MSVLLVGDGGSLRGVLAARLIAQGDEVRAIELEPAAAEELRSLGVHVAKGHYLDADLVERAAQNVRTIVVLEPTREVLESVIEGARFAAVERLVLCGERIADLATHALGASQIDHVILSVPRKKFFKGGPSEEKVAEAIDAADDLAGNPRLELDLGEATSWAKLKLDGP